MANPAAHTSSSHSNQWSATGLHVPPVGQDIDQYPCQLRTGPRMNRKGGHRFDRDQNAGPGLTRSGQGGGHGAVGLAAIRSPSGCCGESVAPEANWRIPSSPQPSDSTRRRRTTPDNVKGARAPRRRTAANPAATRVTSLAFGSSAPRQSLRLRAQSPGAGGWECGTRPVRFSPARPIRLRDCEGAARVARCRAAREPGASGIWLSASVARSAWLCRSCGSLLRLCSSTPARPAVR